MKNNVITTLKHILLSSVCLSAALTSHGEMPSQPGPAKAREPEKQKSYFFASLLPKAFQSHPLLAIAVITEMTEEGKKRPLPTESNPSYYYCDYRYHEEGHAPTETEKNSLANLKKLVQGALANNHYLPANKEHPAELILFMIWGVHAKLELGDPSHPVYTPSDDGSAPTITDFEQGFEDVGHRNLLSRAQLVGGTKFAKELEQALKDKDRNIMGGPFTLDPVYRFTIKNDLNQNLMEQVLDDCYYVVISAYDGASLVQGQKKLLWRTKLSTPAQGVSLLETTPALIASGGPYFGRDTNGPTVVDKRINRQGTVGMGELKTISMDETSEDKNKAAPAATTDRK